MSVARESNLHLIDGYGGGGLSGDLAAGLQQTGAEIDREIVHSGAPARIAAAVLAEVGAGRGRPHGVRWLAIAATLMLAAGLGGLFETTRPQSPRDVNVVVLDPLTFSAVAVDQ